MPPPPAPQAYAPCMIQIKFCPRYHRSYFCIELNIQLNLANKSGKMLNQKSAKREYLICQIQNPLIKIIFLNR